mgnify:FL=1
MVGIGRELRLALCLSLKWLVASTASSVGVDSPIYLQNKASNMEYDIKSTIAIPVVRNTRSS